MARTRQWIATATAHEYAGTALHAVDITPATPSGTTVQRVVGKIAVFYYAIAANPRTVSTYHGLRYGGNSGDPAPANVNSEQSKWPWWLFLTVGRPTDAFADSNLRFGEVHHQVDTQGSRSLLQDDTLFYCTRRDSSTSVSSITVFASLRVLVLLPDA